MQCIFVLNQRPQEALGSWPALEILVRLSWSVLMPLPIHLERKLLGLMSIKQWSMKMVLYLKWGKKPIVINLSQLFYLLLLKGFRLWSWTSDSGMSYLSSVHCDQTLTLQKRIIKHPKIKHRLIYFYLQSKFAKLNEKKSLFLQRLKHDSDF